MEEKVMERETASASVCFRNPKVFSGMQMEWTEHNVKAPSKSPSKSDQKLSKPTQGHIVLICASL